MGVVKAFKELVAIFLIAALSVPFTVSLGLAQTYDLNFGELKRERPGGRRVRDGARSTLPSFYPWMSSEIADAWQKGFQGQGSRITSVDDFRSNWRYWGSLGTRTQLLRHGEWVSLEAAMIAPSATRASHDFYSSRAVRLKRNQLDILNLSYGMFAADGFSNVRWGRQEASIISYARSGTAVVVKAAGNDAVAVDARNLDGSADYLNRDLIGAQAIIFVGALDRNGAKDDLARMAGYSNYAGSNQTVQNQFLTVGVLGDLTGLYGTSFAAPIVSGYAAVLGSKFRTATPTQITNQLLDTARTDTILGYNVSVHGRGEASISRALAPTSIR